ncbi:hypothetical protein I302_101888 [Kwoniella bestiolae CBS 10118]|uniref:Aminoglycoside phosphotransferase domain-containing protein n=1 Tax=Kwoniella bestiolae CBS 10118 TaxID=1296100 RepID=A0AAJ8M5U2_9TREE
MIGPIIQREGTKVGPDEEVYTYLVLLELRDIVKNAVSEELDGEGPFYVRHADDHWEHCLAGEDGEVKGVIDWEWAYTTSKEEAFSAPDTLLPPGLAKTDDDSTLSHREEALVAAYGSLGRPDLADCIKGGRRYSRLMSSLRHNWASVEDLRAIRKGFGIEVGQKYPMRESKEDWMGRMTLKYKDDEGLKCFLDNPVSEPQLPEGYREV